MPGDASGTLLDMTSEAIQPIDLQINGYAGIDFADSELSLEQALTAEQFLRADGVAGISVTLITDSIERLVQQIKRWVGLLEHSSTLADMVLGFHIEGPFLSPKAGYIGAHDASQARTASVEAAQRLFEAAEGRLMLFTLAPEQDPGFRVTSYLAKRGVIVSAGHCDPSLDQLRGALDAGLSMVTHLGNGCPVTLDRHDNVLQRLLAFRHRLWFGMIADGVHVP